MTTQTSRTTSQPWQEALDLHLVARLLQRVTKPGVISTRMAETLLARLQSANQSSPLVAELLQRYGSEELFRDDHVPIVYAHLSQTSKSGSGDRVTAATTATPQRFGHSPTTSPHIVRNLEQTERPVIVGAFISRTQPGHAKRERIDKTSSATASGQPQSSPVAVMPQEHSPRVHPDKRRATKAVDQNQSVPVVTIQRHRPQITEQEERVRIIVHPTRIVREDISHTAEFSHGVTHTVGQISVSGQSSAKLPSIRDKTRVGELSPRQEVTPHVFTAPQEVVRPHTGDSVERAATHPQSSSRQPPVVTASRRSLTLTPPTLTLVRAASPSPVNSGAMRPIHHREPHVQPLSGAPPSREQSLSSGTTLRANQTGASTTSMPIAKVASPSTPTSTIPARELHELTEKVQQKLDIDALAEKVQRQLRRRLLVEHERRGKTRWT